METTDLPALYQSTDSSSVAAQKQFLRATTVRLVSLLLAAIAGAFDLKVGRVNPLALFGLICFLVAIGTEVFLLLVRPDRTWYEGRAAAESAKTLAWRYAVGGAPFPVPDHMADDDFLRQLEAILHDLNDLQVGPVLAAEQQITEGMRALRALDFPLRKQQYELHRIEDQRAWYARKSRWNGTRRICWSVAAILGEFSGILAGALRAFGQIHFDLLGIFAAMAAGAAAWSQAKQYETLERAYFIASQELTSIRSAVKAQPEKDWPMFVDNAEEAISREHTLWRASHGMRA